MVGPEHDSRFLEVSVSLWFTVAKSKFDGIFIIQCQVLSSRKSRRAIYHLSTMQENTYHDVTYRHGLI